MNILKFTFLLILFPFTIFANPPSQPVQSDSSLCKALREKPIDFAKVKQAVDSGDSIDVYCFVNGSTASSALYLSLEATKPPQNDIRSTQYLIDHGADFEFLNYYLGWKNRIFTISNFSAIVANGNIFLVNAYLKQKPNLKSLSGQVAVGIAFQYRFWDIAELLLASGANKYSINGETALMYSIHYGAPRDFIDRLFADWNFKYDNTDLTDGYLLEMIKESMSPIYIQKIIDQGANPKSIRIDSFLPSLLEKGVQRGNAITVFAHRQPHSATPEHLALMNYFISLGLDPSENNPILIPAYVNDDVMNWLGIFLLEHGANPNAIVPVDTLNPNINFSALQLAILEGGGASLELIKAFLDYGANINYVTNNNTTALCLAVGTTGSAWYRAETALELIKRGADVNGPCGNISILCQAKRILPGKWKGSQEVYDTLIKKGAQLGQCQ